ncbi:hypothetical protein BVC93_00540 [Mycobacterium sp. MS1601]|nr:hypothetical protein BVC93_00540 [Mycobacterium sp. MS1601]
MRENGQVSTTVEAILVTALVFGIVVVMFVIIYAWEKRGKGSRLQRRVDRFFDRIGEMLDR